MSEIDQKKDVSTTEPQHLREFRSLIAQFQTALTTESQNSAALSTNRVLLEESLKEFIQDYPHRFVPSAKTTISRTGMNLKAAFSPAVNLKEITALEKQALTNGVITKAVFFNIQAAYESEPPRTDMAANPDEYNRLVQLYQQLLGLYTPFPE
jgi:hypothetical protein